MGGRTQHELLTLKVAVLACRCQCTCALELPRACALHAEASESSSRSRLGSHTSEASRRHACARAAHRMHALSARPLLLWEDPLRR